ncbi:hypothetical protein G4B88_020991 [Cannabis sativa]|uniref:protein-serine/threonine phosphatase n=1 Tax=Cannabis sativa TaxID=3483 RepID=A0A7J6DLI3_CANSA|nr:hypothetical protein G4B88_020991 [Cannabis sativa]
MSTRSEHHTVPLSVLLERELANEKIEKTELIHGQASQSKKGEDFTLIKIECQRMVGDGVSTYSVFALFDGHNGSAAAIYAKENLLNNVLSAMPVDLNRDEWIAALPRALVAGFVKTDKDFQERAHMSGTTVTFVIIEGWIVTVASVGDSRCILEAAEGSIYYLSADHRLDCNEEECPRGPPGHVKQHHSPTGHGEKYRKEQQRNDFKKSFQNSFANCFSESFQNARGFFKKSQS